VYCLVVCLSVLVSYQHGLLQNTPLAAAIGEVINLKTAVVIALLVVLTAISVRPFQGRISFAE